MDKKNFLLGKGEKLTRTLPKKGASGEKKPPYSFNLAKERVTKKINDACKYLDNLENSALPSDKVIANIVIHPRFISKSDFPREFLDEVGLVTVGGTSKYVKPEQWGIEKHPDGAVTDTLFVSTTRTALRSLAKKITSWGPDRKSHLQIQSIEDLVIPTGESKVKGAETQNTSGLFEVVLHSGATQAVISSFYDFLEENNLEAVKEKVKFSSGITFIPVRGTDVSLSKIASFTYVRAVRRMPTLRTYKPSAIRVLQSRTPVLPGEQVLDSEIRTAIFDGGIPQGSPLLKWVNCYEGDGVGEATVELLHHGEAVTSAVLFGHISDINEIPMPFSTLDHIRVIDKATGADGDFEFYDVLDRILNHLDSVQEPYNFVNFSLGPDMAVEDDEINRWTFELDLRFAKSDVLAAVAVGNTGELDSNLKLNRIQPPSDGVNVLSVGSCDSPGNTWGRASYSSIGPGRTPGVAKPDGLSFGGTSELPFGVISSYAHGISGVEGTSFATPYALRTCIGTRALVGDGISPLGIRALMLHHSDTADHNSHEVGWGRFMCNPEELLACEDDEVTILYEGLLPISKYLRAPIPVPTSTLAGNVQVKATLVIAPEVDPAFAHAYTRAGLEVVFRPDTTKVIEERDAEYSNTDSFFSTGKIYNKSELQLRQDGHKWEPCLKASKTKRGSSLIKPCFDLYYHNRDEGRADKEARPMPYALLVSLKAPRVKNLYSQVLSAYSEILVALEPRIQVPVSTLP
ncbi:S8 family peptidase [Pseudomonas aeruginosa]|uniref:S8 family peptidase n=1 Tax=Pseudomonas aeruginosa TaxID=287 RepID=UPI000F818907|nr:S8 family peptidase [Pseudomonas aeruginosa]RTW10514.1 S8 family peptidase [Pseudomonas aeruginosa]